MEKICIFVAYFIMLKPPRQKFLKNELELSDHTIVDWQSFCREVLCVYWVESHSEKIGGEGVIVEIDEAKIGKRKYNRGRLIDGKWIFGGYERNNGRMFIVPVPERTAETLIKIIKDWILPGTIIMSDCWKAYNCLKNEDFQHYTVNHSLNFVDPDTGAHTQNIKKQIDELSPVITEFHGSLISCYSSFTLTMIDGKICSWLTNTPGQNCHLCRASPKQMNDIDVMLERLVKEDNLEYGISSLHAWIKTFECILHISYRLEICKWQIRKEDKEKVGTRKKEIQEKFRRHMGLLVDMPKPGFGTTNDGNTARRFFRNPELASEITGVNEEFIRRMNIILITISCGFEVDSTLFKSYCIDTAKIYVNLYPWYYMPQSLHKILIHGADLINKLVLPIGQMSEEVQESRNKDSKQYREFFSRKFTRQQTLEDMMHMLLVSSDPVISSLRSLNPKKSNPLPLEVRKMIKCIDIDLLNNSSENESSDNDDESE